MFFKQFIQWLSEPNPQKVFKDNIEQLGIMISTDGFKIYDKVTRWRIHNIAERILLKPKSEEYLLGYIEGLRSILKDKKNLDKLYKQFKERK